MKKNKEFFSSCPRNCEDLLEKEVIHNGGLETKITGQGVRYKGNLETAYRMLLWSRIATRVLMHVHTHTIETVQDIARCSFKVPWPEYFSRYKTFAVRSVVKKRSDVNNQYAALLVKDGIVDRFRKQEGHRPDVNTVNPLVSIFYYLEGDSGTIYLDLNGASLHERGYKAGTGPAGLKENLAAAVLQRSGWSENSEGRFLLDAFCGNGTLCIEAAMMAANIPPGLHREQFTVYNTLVHDTDLWKELRREAKAGCRTSSDTPCIAGTDLSSRAVRNAVQSAESAGVEGWVQFRRMDMEQALKMYSVNPNGIIVTNPPYGKRLGNEDEVGALYSRFGEYARQFCPGWEINVLTSRDDFAFESGLKSEKTNILYNGQLKCTLFRTAVYDDEDGSEPGAREQIDGDKLEEGLQPPRDLINRLAKNHKLRRKWAKKRNINAFRLYDRDLPEYAFAVDVYNSAWFLVFEYAAPQSIPGHKAAERRKLFIEALKQVFDVPDAHIINKTRKRQKGASQYERQDTSGSRIILEEAPARFELNLRDYLDTGIFLDHRPVREYIYSIAEGTRFCNLFAYTGTATVMAALGGAVSSVTIDTSNTYCDWALRNFKLNELSPQLHKVIRDDCLQFLEQSNERFDIIFCDPPTFSNNRSEGRLFRVQDDHAALVELCMNHLEKSGVLVFSNNYRSFKMDPTIAEKYLVENITAKTIPRDFERNQRIHTCHTVQHRG